MQALGWGFGNGQTNERTDIGGLVVESLSRLKMVVVLLGQNPTKFDDLLSEQPQMSNFCEYVCHCCC